jgi:hypothetical protein
MLVPLYNIIQDEPMHAMRVPSFHANGVKDHPLVHASSTALALWSKKAMIFFQLVVDNDSIISCTGQVAIIKLNT